MWNALITGITMGLYLAISVGPLLFTVIRQSLDNGIKGGFSFTAGIWLSDILFVVVSNVFTVFTTHFADVYIKQIGYCGGALLLGLGLYYTFFKGTTVVPLNLNGPQQLRKRDVLKLFATGFLINTLNPILFFEWLTAATVLEKAYAVNYRILIFSVCLGINILSDVLKVLLAGKIKPKLTPVNLRIINRVTGAILLVCGAFLLYQTFYHSDKWRKRQSGVAWVSHPLGGSPGLECSQISF